MYSSHEELNNIDDTRNGLLLMTTLHKFFGRINAAFLKVWFIIKFTYLYNLNFQQTPNFGLTTEDIPYRPNPNLAAEDITYSLNTSLATEDTPYPGHSASRLTLQYFPQKDGSVETTSILSLHAPHNSDAYQPQDISEWPPNMLLDITYAAAALHAWGSEDFIRYVQSETQDIYYPRDNNPSSSCHTQEANPGDDMLDVILALWKHSARKCNQQCLQDIETAESAFSKNKVQQWLHLGEDLE